LRRINESIGLFSDAGQRGLTLLVARPTYNAKLPRGSVHALRPPAGGADEAVLSTRCCQAPHPLEERIM